MNNKYEFEESGSFGKGMMWATLLSVPLWLSFFGWIKIISNITTHMPF